MKLGSARCQNDDIQELHRELSHLHSCSPCTPQTFSHATYKTNNSAVVGCISDGQQEYRALVDDLVELSERDPLFLIVNRTTEMTDCRRKRVAIPPVSIPGQNANVEEENKYLDIHTDNR